MLELLAKYQNVATLSLGFVIIAISANQIAKLFQQIHLPLITGLIIMGIFTGPYVLKLIPLTAQIQLKYINEISLGFIAFAAGAELYLKELKAQINSIKWITIGQLIISFLVGILMLWGAHGYIPFMMGKDTLTILAIASLMATIFLASSPPPSHRRSGKRLPGASNKSFREYRLPLFPPILSNINNAKFS